MTRTATIVLAAMIALSPTKAKAQPATDEASSEEAAALYFAPPPTEETEPAIDAAAMEGAGAVALAIGLGQIEAALEGCRELRRDVTGLIGDEYGSYSVNPGWLRRYQSCVLARSDEARAVGREIQSRQTALLERIDLTGASFEETEADAGRAADLMARLSARQSGVQLAVKRELRRQKALVRYYNTGERPLALKEEAPIPDAPASAEVDQAISPTEAATGGPMPLRRD